MKRTLHGSELAWLELLLSGSYPRQYGRSDGDASDSLKDTISPVVPLLTMPSETVASGDNLDLLDPEGVTLASLTVEATSQASTGETFVIGRPEPRSEITHADYRELRRSPAEVKQGWGDRPAVALWGDPPLTLAVRNAARTFARECDRPLLQIVPLPSGRDTDTAAHLPARLARLESTRDPGDRAVVAPDPGWHWQASEILSRAVVVAAYGAHALLVPPDRLADLGGDRGEVERSAAALGVELIQLAVPISETGLDPDVIDQAVVSGTPLPEWFAEPAVSEAFRRQYRPRVRGGFAVLLSGLSGSGKSTVARHLAARLLENDDRSVSLLDGDVVRHNLSKGLGFSREDRDTNVRRIGFVSGEIVKAGGIAVACPIAPYDATRKDVRAMVEAHGGFVLVHVATPLEECERRDRKGLYAAARRGEIPEFTGISDPYEAPSDAEAVVDTTDISIDAAVQQVLEALRRLGYLPAN